MRPPCVAIIVFVQSISDSWRCSVVFATRKNVTWVGGFAEGIHRFSDSLCATCTFSKDHGPSHTLSHAVFRFARV